MLGHHKRLCLSSYQERESSFKRSPKKDSFPKTRKVSQNQPQVKERKRLRDVLKIVKSEVQYMKKVKQYMYMYMHFM